MCDTLSLHDALPICNPADEDDLEDLGSPVGLDEVEEEDPGIEPEQGYTSDDFFCDQCGTHNVLGDSDYDVEGVCKSCGHDSFEI
jgi:hypothetical protein